MTFVRSVKPSDIAEIERIAAESGLSIWTQRAFSDEIARSDSIFLLVEMANQEISGFIIGRIVPGPDAEIYNIAVSQSARRRGFGRILLTEFIAKCTDRGVSNIWLEVRCSNATAISFYTEMGFTDIGVRPNFYTNPTEDARLMKLVIKSSEHAD